MAKHLSVFVTCEHASNRVPEELLVQWTGDRSPLESHVAWDPGAAQVADSLARSLGVPMCVGEWSRLVADLNRSPDNPEALPESAFDVVVPWNVGLSPETRRERLRIYHEPHWRKVAQCIDDCIGIDRIVLHLGVHSFTPVYRGRVRDLDIGLLFNSMRETELRLAEVLRRELEGRGLEVRYNQPYDGATDSIGQSFRERYSDECYASIEFEINQRLQDDLERVRECLLAAVVALY